MMQLIILIIFVLSFGGILFILARKIPILVELSQSGSSGFKKHQFILDIENRIEKIFVSFKKQIFLHKFLLWVRCLTIKAEVKIDHLLHSIRKKAQQIDKDLKDKK